MKCIYCGCENSRVVDSRPVEDGNSIRRRRQCSKCGRRFTTYERSYFPRAVVIKRDGTREEFSPDRVRTELRAACVHRPAALLEVDDIVDRVDERVRASGPEIAAEDVSAIMLDELLKVDHVAYVRLASVCRRFDDPNEFVRVVQQIAVGGNDESGNERNTAEER